MARHPSFFVLGGLAGLGVFLSGGPTPFPFLGILAMTCGGLGFAVSLAYVWSFEPWRWRTRVASLRRARRRLARAFGAEPAAAVRAARAKS